jgi:hypothetical protein
LKTFPAVKNMIFSFSLGGCSVFRQIAGSSFSHKFHFMSSRRTRVAQIVPLCFRVEDHAHARCHVCGVQFEPQLFYVRM